MQKRLFALSFFTAALCSAWWLRPVIERQANAAELPTKKALPTAASQPIKQSTCFRGAVTPQPKHEHNAKDASVTLGNSFVIPKELAKETSHIPAVSYRVDGEKLFTVTSRGNLLIWDSDTQKIEENIALTKDVLQAVTIDPRGCFVAWSTKDSFSLLAIGDSFPTTLKKISPQGISFSPNLDVVALHFADKVELRSTKDASLKKDLKGFTGEVTNLSFSPDGKTLGVTTKGGELSLIDTASYKATTVKKMGPIYALAFSPDSNFIAFGGEERIVYQRDILAAKEEVITKDQPYWITTVSYSPDGEFIAFGDESCDVWLFDRDEKKNLFHSKHHVECWLSGVAWTPDSEVFLFGCKPNTYDGTPRVYTSNNWYEAGNASEVARLDKEIEGNAATLAKMLEGESMAAYRERYAAALKKQQAARSVSLNHNNFSVGWNMGNYLPPNGPPINIYIPNAAVGNLSVNLNNNDVNNNGIGNFVGAGVGSAALTSELKALFEEMKKDPTLKDSVTTLWSLNEQRDKSFNERFTQLNESFCVNQWVVRR